jgi:hypothetical protein
MRDGHLWTPWASSPMFLSAAWRLNSSQTQISSAFLLESDFVRPHDTHLILDYVSQGVDSREASDRQNLTAPYSWLPQSSPRSGCEGRTSDLLQNSQ